MEIPHFAEILPDLNKSGYLQFRFKWTDNNGFTITARVHQPIPGSNYFDDGQVWIINRKKPVNPGEIKIEHIYLNDGTWFRFEDNANLLGSDNWKGLINRQKKIPPRVSKDLQSFAESRKYSLGQKNTRASKDLQSFAGLVKNPTKQLDFFNYSLLFTMQKGVKHTIKTNSAYYPSFEGFAILR